MVKPRTYLVCLLPIWFVTLLLVSKAQRKSNTTVVQSVCEEFLNNLNIPIPTILIDMEMLVDMKKDSCKVKKRIKIGVDEKYSPKHILWHAALDIVYFKDDEKKDYLEFQSDQTQLIPKNFDHRMIGEMKIPTDSQKFSEFFKRSKYVKCNKRTMKRKAIRPDVSPQALVDTLALLRDELLQFNMFSFLSDGTLLGWYRECSVIPHTADMDLAVFSWDYNIEYASFISENSWQFRLTRKLGMLNDSYELTVMPRKTRGIPIDIFLMYKSEKDNKTEYYTGGMDGDGNRVKFVYPSYDPWCATDLLGHIFWVSCTPESKLKYAYGDKWYEDHPSESFSWNHSPKNMRDYGKWSEEQMINIHDVLV